MGFKRRCDFSTSALKITQHWKLEKACFALVNLIFRLVTYRWNLHHFLLCKKNLETVFVALRVRFLTCLKGESASTTAAEAPVAAEESLPHALLTTHSPFPASPLLSLLRKSLWNSDQGSQAALCALLSLSWAGDPCNGLVCWFRHKIAGPGFYEVIWELEQSATAQLW